MRISNLSRVAMVLTLAITQTGCITGIAFGTPLLMYVGTGVGAPAWLVGTMGTTNTATTRAMVLVGLILDEENPGRSEFLNGIPETDKVAQKLNVSIDTIVSYNNHLNSILALNDEIASSVEKISENKVSAETLNEMAVSVGLDDGEELINVMKGHALERKDLRRLSLKRSIPEDVLSVYLKNHLKVRISAK